MRSSPATGRAVVAGDVQPVNTLPGLPYRSERRETKNNQAMISTSLGVVRDSSIGTYRNVLPFIHHCFTDDKVDSNQEYDGGG